MLRHAVGEHGRSATPHACGDSATTHDKVKPNPKPFSPTPPVTVSCLLSGDVFRYPSRTGFDQRLFSFSNTCRGLLPILSSDENESSLFGNACSLPTRYVVGYLLK